MEPLERQKRQRHRFSATRVILYSLILILIISLTMAGCAFLSSEKTDFVGSLIGNEFNIDTFDNFGTLTMQTHGEKIDVEPIIIQEKVYNHDTGWSYINTLSSAINITIDGHNMTSCGDTMIFYDEALVPDYNFQVSKIESKSDDFTDNTAIAGMVNKVKNLFGKPVVVVIKSQTGYPIYAFSGNDVYQEFPEDLPKFTKLSIDGKPLYIHRANFQIIDLELIDN